MRDKIAYALMTFILKLVATKEYRSFVKVSTDLGVYTLENDLLGLDKNKWSEKAKAGEYIFQNWNKDGE